MILFIGDGMPLQTEISASRYLTGTTDGLSFHGLPFRTAMTTWDVTTYDRYAWARGAERFDPNDFDPTIGYDSERGGPAPYPHAEVPDPDYFLQRLPAWPTEHLSPARPAPDAASAGTALAAGVKTDRGNVAWQPGDSSGGEAATFAEWARQNYGLSIGLVSTTPFSHATAATFVAHNVSADNVSPNQLEEGYAGPTLSEQILEDLRPEVVIAAGHAGNRFLTAGQRAELSTAGDYVFVERQPNIDGSEAITQAAEQALSQDRKLFGLFGGADDHWDIPRPRHAPGSPSFELTGEDPSLGAGTTAALRVLSSNPQGFSLTVVAGDIEWASDAADYGWLLGAIHRLEEAATAAIEFIDTDPSLDWSDTLLLVASTHASGGLRFSPTRSLQRGELPAELSPYLRFEWSGPANELVSVCARGAGAEALAGIPSWYGGTGPVDLTQIHTELRTIVRTGVARNVLMLVGSGMHAAHELGASRYGTGTDSGLRWQQPDFNFQALATTWDRETYDRYAYASRQRPYNASDFDPTLGYDLDAGGAAAEVVWHDADPHVDYFLTELPGYVAFQPSAYPATGSASAVTAMATGTKTEYGNLAWAPGDREDGSLETLGESARREHGVSIGVVSSVPFSHATPAGFVSHNVSRYNYLEIADEIIFDFRPEVVIGGGHPLHGGSGWIGEDALAELESASDCELVQRQEAEPGGPALRAAAAAAAESGRRLFGLFGSSDGAFERLLPVHDPGRPRLETNSDEDPTLTDTVDAALRVLAARDRSFFLMVEQGDIDWANHQNQFPWMVGATVSLHHAVQAALDFVDEEGDAIERDNTLIIVTTDHANGYLRPTGSEVLDQGELPENWRDFIAYSSGDHTNELCMVYASEGEPFEAYEGAWYPGLRIIDNTHLYELMMDYLSE